MSGEATEAAAHASRGGNGGRRALLAALAANLAIALAKAIAFLFTGSIVMLAEVAHSLADGSKQLLLFVGRVRAGRSPDREHPLGYGRERYFWAFLVAILLFPLGAVWTSLEAFDQLREPRPIAHVGWAAGVLLAALVFESLSLRVAVRASRRPASLSSLWRFVRRSRDPDIPSVLLEDAGAVVGAGLGLLSLAAASWTGDPRWDAVGGFAIALLLLGIGAVLAVEFKSLLIGEAATSDVHVAIERALLAPPQVRRVVWLHTLHLAPDELLVLARVAIDSGLSLREADELVEAVRQRVRDATSHAARVYVESQPDPQEVGEGGERGRVSGL